MERGRHSENPKRVLESLKRENKNKVREEFSFGFNTRVVESVCGDVGCCCLVFYKLLGLFY